MSYDLAFWKARSSLDADPGELYRAMVAGDFAQGVDRVEGHDVVAACRKKFWNWSIDHNIWSVLPQASGEGPGFDLLLGEQIVVFTCYGLNHDMMNDIIDVMVDLGYPLYDLQVGERFDSQA